MNLFQVPIFPRCLVSQMDVLMFTDCDAVDAASVQYHLSVVLSCEIIGVHCEAAQSLHMHEHARV